MMWHILADDHYESAPLDLHSIDEQPLLAADVFELVSVGALSLWAVIDHAIEPLLEVGFADQDAPPLGAGACEGQPA